MVKKILRLFFILSFFCLSGLYTFADQPPDPGGGPGGGDDPVGGGSPLGAGLFIMATLGAAYAAKKTISFHQDK